MGSRQHPSPRADDVDARRSSPLYALALAAAVAGTGLLLWGAVGPPARPDFPPWPADPLTTWSGAARDWWARHSRRPFSGIAGATALPWLVRLLWLLWALLAVSVARELLSTLAAFRPRGRGRGPRSARRPRPGRVLGGVGGWLAGLRLLQIGGGAVGAAPPEPPVAHALPLDLSLGLPAGADPAAAQPVAPQGARATGGQAGIPTVAATVVEHLVESGDTLWDLAERYYGNGQRYGEIVEANTGRAMPDGRPFDGQLRPGDRLAIPGPARGAALPAGVAPGYEAYIVEPGETLRSIAEEVTGDERDWHRILTADGRAATALPNPDLIHPGDRFLVPLAAPGGAPPAPPAPVAPLAVAPLAGVTPAGETVTLAAPTASDGATLAVVAVGPAAHGRVALTADGRIAYTAPADHRGGDSFSFTATDGQGRQASGTATISVVALPADQPQPARSTVSNAAFASGARAVALVPVAAVQPATTGPAGPPPAAATPAPSARVPDPTPAAAPAAGAPTGDTASQSDDGAPLAAAAAGLGTVGAAAAVATAARRWSRRGWRFAPSPASSVAGSDTGTGSGWHRDPGVSPTEAATGAEAFSYRAIGGEVEPVTRLVAVLDRALADGGFAARVVCAAYEQGLASALVAADAEERETLLAGAAALGARLGCRAAAELPGGTRGLVELRLTRLRVASFYGQEVPRDLPALRLATLPSGAAVALNWAAPQVGHLLVAGADPGAVQELLAVALAELVGRRAPGDLAIWGVGDGALLRDSFADAPHLADSPLASRDRAGLLDLLGGLTAELALREGEGAGERAELLLVIEDLAALDAGDEALMTALERLGRDGARHGIRLLAGATAAGDAGLLLDHFRSRLVLRVDAATSTLLLGSRIAAGLADDGGLVARWGGAPPQPFADYPPDATRAVVIEPDELRDLLAAVGAQYAAESARADTAPDTAETGTAEPLLSQTQEGGAASVADMSATQDAPLESALPLPVSLPVEASSPSRATADPPDEPPIPGIVALPSGDDDAATPDDHDGEEAESASVPGLEDDAIEAAFTRRYADARAGGGTAPPIASAAVASAVGPGMARDGVDRPGPSAASRAGPLLRIRALGPVAFAPDNGLASRFATQAKPLQLLLALACTPPGSVGWEQLCGMLWPEEDLAPAQARNRFHRLMSELRGLLAESVPGLPREAIRAASGSYTLDPAYIQSDVHEFLAALDRVRDADGDLDGAIAALAVARDRWTGELCTGQLAEWLTPSDTARLVDRYARQLADAGRRLAARAARLKRWPEARLLYGLLLEEDPCKVEWVRALMAACAELGDARGILAVESAYGAALGEGFGVDGRDDPAIVAIPREVRDYRKQMLARARAVGEVLAGAEGTNLIDDARRSGPLAT